MLTVEEAVARIRTEVPRQPAEEVPLSDALGRVLAEEVLAAGDVPPWDNSAMDGYAVRAADLHGARSDAPVGLQLVGTIGAGQAATRPVGPGEAQAIMTGAPLPAGADAVVMVEDTDGARSGRVAVLRAPERGQHIRRAGSDVPRGSVVLAPGVTLGPAQLGLAAAVGRPTLRVARRPVVAVIATGDELVAPGRPLGPGQIWSSNQVALVAMIREAGADAIDLGVAGDAVDATVDALRRALAVADAVVTTGGVSVGAFDHVKEAHQQLGAAVDFWKVKMKPGKPLAFGRVRWGDRAVPLFGLPGNPVSCLVNFAQFVRPWIRDALGDPSPFLPVIDAVAGEDLTDPPGRARLQRVRLVRGPGGWEAWSAGSQSSGALSGMARADGLLLIGATSAGPVAGAPCRVQLLRTDFLAQAAPDYGW
jgi:molybdopterin molybdotransferase